MKKIIFFIFILLLYGCCEKKLDGTFDKNYCASEIKFCSSENKVIYDAYMIKSDFILECSNSTGISKYKFSNGQSSDGDLGTGLLLGYFIFSK